MKEIIENTDIIILKNTQESDLDLVVEWEHQPDNAQYVGQWTREQHRVSLSQEDILHLSIKERSTNQLIGYVILAGITNPNHNIEFRRIVISDKGHGFGRETLNLVKKIAFKQLNAHRLWLDVRYKNQKAQRLYKSEGFVEEGILRECILYHGSYESLIVMSILKSEYVEGIEASGPSYIY
ncbi:RimJ/RimL family protein N-acetyltransferase [Lacrimispora xylanisolvens]|uniref:RimJ/RimL family protein N-acetyltransferase n=1 Tax=Lacrimispora xylanisolvens TaxID=384636 RepID=A0A2S6HDL7_9FIRM|nr:GNAT family protein [Hungatella xylanolytica]PPK75491.1 RimJ/RimL family protein N-acetyltransferase [Hungatella xylanolytica]